MANIKSAQVAGEMPVPSHGFGGNVKCVRFQVPVGVQSSADTVEFGFLPDYAVVVEAIMHTTGTVASIDVGITGDADGLFDGVALVANVPLRSALTTLYGKNTGEGLTKVTGLFNGASTAGTLNLTLFFLVEDEGTGYPFVPAVA